MHLLNKLTGLFFLSMIVGLHCKNEDQKVTPTTSTVKDSIMVKGLDLPWEILWGPDNFIWITEKKGRVCRVNPQSGQVIPLLTISEVVSNGEGGLLGMALHPDFKNTRQVFVAYDYTKAGTYTEKVVRYTYDGRTLVDPVTIIDNIAAAGNHDGCRLLTTPDLKLFITTGDATNQSLPQDPKALNGKILRLNLDGSIPDDNPVPGNPYWSIGHRNPEGLVFANQKLYSSEHGPDSDDELNIIEKGRNYGWPAVKGFCNEPEESSFCTTNNVKEPIKAWTPTVAVCGLDYYAGNTIPAWQNSLLLVSLKNSRLYQLKLDSTHAQVIESNEYFRNTYGRLRDLCISPAGYVYICTSNGNNKDGIIVVGPK